MGDLGDTMKCLASSRCPFGASRSLTSARTSPENCCIAAALLLFVFTDIYLPKYLDAVVEGSSCGSCFCNCRKVATAAGSTAVCSALFPDARVFLAPSVPSRSKLAVGSSVRTSSSPAIFVVASIFGQPEISGKRRSSPGSWPASRLVGGTTQCMHRKTVGRYPFF